MANLHSSVVEDNLMDVYSTDEEEYEYDHENEFVQYDDSDADDYLSFQDEYDDPEMCENLEEVLVYENGSYYARRKETSSKKCAMNRRARLRLINKLIFGDKVDGGFADWNEFTEMSFMTECDCLCVCGHVLKKRAYFIARKHPTKGTVRACIGDACIKQLEKLYKSNFFALMKKHLKKCAQCGKRSKKMERSVCTKCEEINEIMVKLDENIRNDFFVDKFLDMKNFYDANKFFHEYQKKFIIKTFEMKNILVKLDENIRKQRNVNHMLSMKMLSMKDFYKNKGFLSDDQQKFINDVNEKCTTFL